MDILRIAVLGIAGVLLALLLQKEKVNTACLSVWQSASAFLFIFLERWRLSSILQKNADVCCSGSDVYHTDIKNGWDHLCGGVSDEYL